MVTMYSKRLLSPYVGVIQVAETGRARALSLDGETWAVRYALADEEPMSHARLGDGPELNFLPVATIEQGRLQTHALHPLLDPGEVRAAIDLLFDAVTSTSVPFGADDRYEYWLLDSSDGSPLALLESSVYPEAMAKSSPRPAWSAMPAAVLPVPDPDPPEQIGYLPPVNYRLEQFVAERAGNNPRAAWFERTDTNAGDFPPCLVREDWEQDEARRLCQLYLNRLAPRLLMMYELPRSVRQRLEQAAREHAFEVERFYPMYPEVVDESALNAARVEARMRRANEA
ncbi:MAG TPA: hypothetical protein VKA50_14885 [Gammaproteobacteria bacterium]|nr:hypothetical protein [Gammaproteobacteria bacterium]